MEPSAWRNGGRGVTIRYGITATNLGPLLVAATMKGICRLSFDEDAEALRARFPHRSEEHTSELQSLMRISYAVFCLKKKTQIKKKTTRHTYNKRTYQ